MKRLIWRLTMTFWALFVVVVCAFCVNFYLNYEKSYSQKLLEIDRNLNTIGEEINDTLTKYTNLTLSVGSVIEGFYESSYQVYQTLPDYQINMILQEIEESNTKILTDDNVLRLAYLQTFKQLDIILSDLQEMYMEQYNLCDFELVPYSNSYQLEDELKTIDYIDKIELTNGVTILEIDKDNQRLGRTYKEIHYKGNPIGYIMLEYLAHYVDIPLISTMDNIIYYIGNNVYIQSDSADLEMVEELSTDNIELVIRELTNKGYYVSRFSPADEIVKMVHFYSTAELQEMVLSQTISLFEFSTILLIISFLFVSYLLFIVIIRPCYLLVDYVRRCGEGDYTIPPGINSSWRFSFVRIRNAYLENERLLAVKDNQSQELEYAWKKALVANQAKTHFLAKVSHELKTPLNAIKGYIQLLKLSIDNPKQLRQIEIIDHSSDLLLKQVDELLDFSVIEDGKVKLEIDTIDLFHTAHVIEELFIINTSKKSLDYVVNIDEQIPSVLYGDEARIKQIIINLMSNALKFTEHGKIEVSFDLDYQTENEVYLSIRVKDTGKGIAENKLNSIFDSFTQENNSISRQFGGTGLGLSISKRLAEVMGGNLIVESKVNVGSTFTLFLPLSKIPIIIED
ncbi:two-component sensor histidine kinase [Turicibacter sanguinis]|uniref:Circadian input-output histidine kinase CikA n=2 Tax=Turicibacter sanguinis TaxID=154288 RepID=A0A9X5ANM5_9FIRM|nr:ATP-binding protein [Turicibacter sanguinis]EFF63231.1 ATPase/histidine kinase/DNA gyrase B/HSP90 domain protein [Turicibacter sanguinis PC909]MCU7191915.1 ATP-binding protein [Turicibacter sanguinis]MCU7211561.1 ATP-binding protein [Turicibacter sanguinis]MDB8438219.1 ATP-binding protein [Turicibacter sanguinis]MDB8459181.1 ATP-binding protein [Turicibacter sanguinis]